MSGVAPRDMKNFYFNHCQRGLPLSEDYEWLETNLDWFRKSSSASFPHWDYVLGELLRNPYVVNTTHVEGGEACPLGDNTVYCSAIYPVASQWRNYLSLSERGKDLITRGQFSTEAEAYDDIKQDLTNKISRLETLLEKERFKAKKTEQTPEERANTGRLLLTKKQALFKAATDLQVVEEAKRYEDLHRVALKAKALEHAHETITRAAVQDLLQKAEARRKAYVESATLRKEMQQLTYLFKSPTKHEVELRYLQFHGLPSVDNEDKEVLRPLSLSELLKLLISAVHDKELYLISALTAVLQEKHGPEWSRRTWLLRAIYPCIPGLLKYLDVRVAFVTNNVRIQEIQTATTSAGGAVSSTHSLDLDRTRLEVLFTSGTLDASRASGTNPASHQCSQ